MTSNLSELKDRIIEWNQSLADAKAATVQDPKELNNIKYELDSLLYKYYKLMGKG